MVDRECFPMGYRGTTLYERGWLDIACGPSITIDIQYSGHHHHPSCGDHTPLLPNTLHVDVDAPVALIRVFGCLARDLLGLKVSAHVLSLASLHAISSGKLSWGVYQNDTIQFQSSMPTS